MSKIPTLPIRTAAPAPPPAYAELHCLSDFSFGRGASSAQELFERARRNGYRALAITDEGSLAGIVRALEASRATGVALIVGSEVQLDDGLKLVLLVENLAGYSTLCQLLTRGRRRSAKGEYRLTRADLDEELLDEGLLDGCLPGLLVLWLPAPGTSCQPPSHDPDATPLRASKAGDTAVPVVPVGPVAGPVGPFDPAGRAHPAHADGLWLRQRFDGRLWLAVELHHGADDGQRLPALLALADALAIPAVATGDVHMHARGRRALQDTITAIRHRTTIAEAGTRLFANGERHLRTRQALAAIYPARLLDESVRIAARCTFQPDQLRYQYPRELVPDGHTPASWLRHLTEQGVQWRWPQNTGMDNGTHDGADSGTDSGADTARARAKALPIIEKELALIAKLGYEPYFLTVHDLVAFARGRGILCQGRGSAANSAVCFALGITEIDPGRMNVLFERFLSEERKEPPDIDVDFEHERREEVIQYLYRRYGRERAALTATVIRYRARSAVRDVARALGLPADQLAQLSRCVSSWSSAGSWSSDIPATERLREHGFDPGNPVVRRLLALVGELLGKPRHLSQHVGGFVISEAPLHMLVPVENAAMIDRTIIQWDKDDLDVLGLIKVDVLALGMLTCVRKTLDLLRAHRGRDLSPATIPAEDPATYEMIQRGDVVGVFQIESRAQMAMLPRLKPACFYDLVIEVAIVRPGPIQGGMVHPYLRRRQGLEPVDYPSEELRPVFERTLGIPLFQEQVMQLAITAAEYTPGEADQLRRAMAAWKRHGGMGPHHDRLVTRMVERGYTPEFAERIFEQIQGFGSYGFPESHAASFAMITYVSCWLKCHEPAAYSCALLNSLPMGFYQPPQLVADARRHGIDVRPIDVCHSDWDSTLEPWPGDPRRQPALRLGLRLARGMREDAARRISAERARAPFRDLDDLAARADLDRGTLDLLAEAAALRSLAGHRHRARWSTAGTERQLPLFANANASAHAFDSRVAATRVANPGSAEPRPADARVANAGSTGARPAAARPGAEPRIAIPPPSAFENTHADYASTGLSLDTHPVALVRRALQQRRYLGSDELAELANGRHARFAGLVILRQRPATASGVTFLTLEDEHGMVNVVVWNDLAERQRRVLLESRLLAVHGRLESEQGSRHLIASRLEDLTALLSGLATNSRDFR